MKILICTAYLLKMYGYFTFLKYVKVIHIARISTFLVFSINTLNNVTVTGCMAL